MPSNYKAFYVLEVGDINGDVAVMRVPTTLTDTNTIAVMATNVAALVTALGAPGTITNGKVIRSGVSLLFNEAQLAGGTPALDAEFPSVADKARLAFSNSNGARAVSAIPAPIEGIFHAPPADATVDPASAVSAWITAFETYARDLTETTINLYQSGVRSKARARRRAQHRI